MRQDILVKEVRPWLLDLVRATCLKELMQSQSEIMQAKQTREQIQLLLMQVAALLVQLRVGFMSHQLGQLIAPVM
jgi:hypothetical protein